MLELRPLAAGEEDLFLSLRAPALVGVESFGRDYREFAALRQYRPEWTWVALRDNKVVARAAWWGGRDTPAVLAAGEARIEVARRAGMQPFVERLRYRWTPEHELPARPGRLVFQAEPDDDVILDVLRRIVDGSLDAHQRRAKDKDAAARDELDFFKWMPSPRDWWRLAFTRDGELVGLTVPGRNYASPVIGVVGVVPELRGHGHAYDLLVEATHLLVGEGVDEIIAETDTTNTPMAATFARAGYPITQERVYLK
jgi:GNAT superfamily N-acetyltransferase